MTVFRDLNDPEKYTRVAAVPIFVPHERMKTGSDGKKRKITVTTADLQTIADRRNQIERDDGVMVRIAPGHTNPDKDAPEQKQPEVWGYARNHRVGRWGPGKKIGLLHDWYIRNDKLAEARTFPFRSPEYYPQAKDITAVALLRRDPELDLGIVTFSRGSQGPVYFYAMENDMDPTAAPDATVDPNAPIEPSHEEKVEQYMRHCHSHPYARYFSEHYGAEGAPGPGMPAAGDVSVPGMGGTKEKEPLREEDESVRMGRDSDAIRYARIERDMKALRESNDQLRYAAEKADAERVVTQLQAEGFAIPDKAKLVGQLAKMPSAARDERCEEIRACYQRDPAAVPQVPLYRGKVEGGAEPPTMTRELRDQAVRYASENDCDFDTALAAVRTSA